MTEHTIKLHVDGGGLHGDLYVSGFASVQSGLSIGHGFARVIRHGYEGAQVTVSLLAQPGDAVLGEPSLQPPGHRQYRIAYEPVSALAREGHAEIIETPPAGRPGPAQTIAVVPRGYAPQVQEALIRAYELGMLDATAEPAEDKTPAEKASAWAQRMHDLHRVHAGAGESVPDCVWCVAKAIEDRDTPPRWGADGSFFGNAAQFLDGPPEGGESRG